MASSSLRRQSGFTIIELLIGVAIVGILAALAIPSFKSYVYRTRVAEATSMLNEIKQRQESYRSKFGQYANVGAATDWPAAVYTPAVLPGVDPVGWTTSADWEALGVSPPGPVRFQYTTLAGGPTDTVPTGSNLENNDFWYAAQARGDLDGDGTTFILEVYSQSPRMYNEASTMGGYE